MTTIQTADGRFLQTRPPNTGIQASYGTGFPGVFPPLWSDGERHPNGLTDGLDGPLRSYDRIYRSQPVLAGVVDMIAYRAATLPFAAFTAAEDGSRSPILPTDTLATLLRRPRPGQATVHLLNHVFTSLFVHGNALWAKIRGGDRQAPPEMLWPLDWGHISAYGEPGGDVEWWSTTQFGQERFIEAVDTVHFAWPGADGYQIGVSPLEKLGITIRLEDAAQRYQTANFRNGNRPSNAISIDKPLSREQREANTAMIASLHKGVDQAGKTILLTGGASIQQLSMTAVEASLIEQRRLDREEISIVYGLSGPSLTDSTNSALGNVAERFRAFYRDVLPPWTTLVAATIEAQLLDPEPAWMGRLARFDFSDKLRGEPREQAETLKILVEGGLVSRDEARQDLGKPPVGGNAAELTVNANNQATINALSTTPNPGPTAPAVTVSTGPPPS
jgi:HK97 family phage portal protein